MRRVQHEFNEGMFRLKLWISLTVLGALIGAAAFIYWISGRHSFDLIQLFQVIKIVLPLTYFQYSLAGGAAIGAGLAYLFTRSKSDAKGSDERPGMRQPK